MGARPANRDSLDQEIIDSIDNNTKFISRAGSKTAKSRADREVLLKDAYPQSSNIFQIMKNPHEMYNENYTNLEHKLHELAKEI